MDRRDKKRLSKYLSLVLRHSPAAGPVTLDERGFCAIDALLAAAQRAMPFPVERADLQALAEQPLDPAEKRRFEIEGDYIRAGHGHSVPIAGYRPVTPTTRLFHATPTAAVAAIKQTGLKAMRRERVHLSTDRAITVEAARRRSRDVTVIEVDVAAAMAAGVGFYESADERIVLCDDVPAGCLRFEGACCVTSASQPED